MKAEGWRMRRAHLQGLRERRFFGERSRALVRILLVVPVVLFVGLSSSGLAPVVLCPFRQLTGLPCPGCGMTRALNALAHGQWELAFSFHPLSPIVAAGVLFLGISAVFTGCLPPQARLHRWSLIGERILTTPWFPRLLLVLALGAWMIRMISMFASGEASRLIHQGWLGRTFLP